VELFKRHRTVEEVLPGFLIEKQPAVEPRSFYPYTWCAKVFIDWLKEHHLASQPMRKITPEHMADFFYFLGRERNLDRTTVEKYLLNLRQFYVYAKRKGDVEILPFGSITLPKKKRDQGADVIQIDDLRILLPEIKRIDPQLYLACMIQYYCFIRPGKELRLLKIGDIDLHNGIITVRPENAKNKQRQSVTMPQQLIDLCLEYEVQNADKSLFVFGNKKRFGSKPCSVNMLRWRFNKIRDGLNMTKGYKFYSFKHTGASRLHMSGISMRELMDQLRHTKLEATQHYVKKHIGIINTRVRDNFPSPI
jgi:integrase